MESVLSFPTFPIEHQLGQFLWKSGLWEPLLGRAQRRSLQPRSKFELGAMRLESWESVSRPQASSLCKEGDSWKESEAFWWHSDSTKDGLLADLGQPCTPSMRWRMGGGAGKRISWNFWLDLQLSWLTWLRRWASGQAFFEWKEAVTGRTLSCRTDKGAVHLWGHLEQMKGLVECCQRGEWGRCYVISPGTVWALQRGSLCSSLFVSSHTSLHIPPPMAFGKQKQKSVGMLGPQCRDSSFTGTGAVQVWESGSLGAAWVTSSPFCLSRG